ncbi:MAG: (d)CMP kinase [Desulfovibrionaceae bacterium]|nr:(d)CMP kinase [Desulfovibrionaceae bacterium]
MNMFVITIDGPAGVGKTTLAKLLADKLEIPFLDTGAMFRTLALRLGDLAFSLKGEELSHKCESFHFTLKNFGANTSLYCNDELIGSEIRTEEVAKLASNLAKIPEVRTILANLQREISKNYSLVAEGRDMGTVVFPNAQFKFFLEAEASVRALRRLNDTCLAKKSDLETLTLQIKERDEQDRNRPIAPLKAAEDALVIDTSHKTIVEVFQIMYESILKGGIGKRVE